MAGGGGEEGGEGNGKPEARESGRPDVPIPLPGVPPRPGGACTRLIQETRDLLWTGVPCTRQTAFEGETVGVGENPPDPKDERCLVSPAASA